MAFKSNSLITAFLILTFITPSTARATDYYVSLSGNDSNNGIAQASAFKTFSKAVSSLSPGDTLYIAGGIYTSPLIINKSGTSENHIRVKPISGQNVTVNSTDNRTISVTGNYIELSGIKSMNGGWTCLDLHGSNLVVDSVEVTGCQSHSIIAFGKNVVVKNSTVHDSVLENKSKTASGGWGSGLKVEHGAQDILFENNKVYNTYGEGIATTMGTNVIFRGNIAYDNYSANFYLDNSHNVTFENNISYCTNNTEYYRDGHPASGILIGEEDYNNRWSDWGARLGNIRIINNLIHGCASGIKFYRAEISGGGIKGGIIAHNTITSLWHNGPGISLAIEPANRDIKIQNNISSGSVTGSSATITVENNLNTTTFATTPDPTNPHSFIPTNTSSAVNSGVISGVNSDFRGSARPLGGNYDIGAFEVGSTGATPSLSPISKPGDLNRDNRVDLLDYSYLLTRYGNPYSIIEFNLLIANFGQ